MNSNAYIIIIIRSIRHMPCAGLSAYTTSPKKAVNNFIWNHNVVHRTVKNRISRYRMWFINEKHLLSDYKVIVTQVTI